MSTAPGTKAPPTKPKKDRERERKEKQPQLSERLKTVVRRLPPNLPEDVFWQSVQPWVSADTVTWKVFHAGKLKKRPNKENIPSRAYIAFKTDEQLAQFSREYDGHVFRDKAGNESQAVVEFAPYQRIPTDKKKLDARNATIEKDEDYISFLESLTTESNREPVSLEALIASAQPVPPPKTTPLLEALKAEKSANKDKEAILRNHAHYKDQQVILARKEEARKKAAAQKAAEAANSGKKANKKGSGAAPPGPTNSANRPAGPSKANGQPNGTPKTPKPPRAPKQTPQSKQAAATPPAQITIATPPTALNVASIVTPGSDATPAATPGPSTPTTPRRPRPVIGLASRHFEAALSGAGVSGAPGDRKSRREREREAAAAATAEPGKAVPPSPKRDRGGRRGGPPGNAGDTHVKVPSILQRVDGPPATILQRETPQTTTQEVNTNGNSGPNVQGPAANAPRVVRDGGGFPPGRGGRRGRGKGRGPPIASDGG